MRYLLGALILILLPVIGVIGQHQPIMSQYMLNKFLYNPAFTGLKDQTSLTAGYRNQWTAIEGAPVNYYLTAHTPIGGENGRSHIGIGGILFTDKIGPLRTSTVSISGAYHTPLTQSLHLSAGLSAGIMQRSMNISELKPAVSNDPVLGAGMANLLQPIVSAGLWAFTSRLYAGISTIQAPAHEISSSLTHSFVNTRHYFANLGGVVKFNRSGYFKKDEEFLLIPSMLVRYIPGFPAAMDYNLRFTYGNILMLGASYRNSRDFVLQTGAEVTSQVFKRKHTSTAYFFSYSYDLGYSELGQVSAGAHEVTIGIHLSRDKVKCPLVRDIPVFFF